MNNYMLNDYDPERFIEYMNNQYNKYENCG